MPESHAPHVSSICAFTPRYSISDGIVQVDAAIARAAADGMPALGISDLSQPVPGWSSSGAPVAGIKPVIGADCWITAEPDQDKPYRVLLICKNRRATASSANC